MTRLPNQKIVVVIPAYRVEKQIERVISKIPSYIDEIIVVNDQSPDETRQLVMKLENQRVHLITHRTNQGVGGAMLSGYGYALELRADVVVKVDGDGQMDLSYLTYLLEPILSHGANYSKGNRFLHPKELKQMPVLRKIGNMGLTFLTKLASGYWNIFDPTNGYTAISRDILHFLDPTRIAKNYFFEISLLCELRRHQAVVEDVPIPAIYEDETSSVNIMRELRIFSVNLFTKFLQRIGNQYFLYDFTVTSLYIISGGILGMFGLVWGIVKWMDSIRSGIPATSGTVLIAVLPIILAVQFLLQAVAQDILSVPVRVIGSSEQEKIVTPDGSRLANWWNEIKANGFVILEK